MKRLLKKYWIDLVLTTIIAACILTARCASAGAYEPVRTWTIGTVLVFAPLEYDNANVGHDWELEGFSFMGTDLGFRFLPKELRFLSPILMGGLDAVWRIPELGKGQDGLVANKMISDGLGIVARTILEVKF